MAPVFIFTFDILECGKEDGLLLLWSRVPESEESFFGESGAGRGNCENEGRQAKGAVDRHKAGPEGRRGRLAAKQKQEAEEAGDELKKMSS